MAYLRKAVVERAFWDKVWRGTTSAKGTTALETTVTSVADFSDHVPGSTVIRDRSGAPRRHRAAAGPGPTTSSRP